MPKYKVKSSGKTYTIPEDKVQAFLTDFPDAFLVEEEGKPNGPAKETAVAGPMTEAQQKAVDMESPLVGGFSELPETKIDPVKWQAAKPVEKAKMLTQEYGEDFKFEFNDRRISRNCAWVAKRRNARCQIDGIELACRDTCGLCD